MNESASPIGHESQITIVALISKHGANLASLDVQAKLAVVVEHFSKKQTKLLLPRGVVVDVLAGLVLPAVLVGMATEQLIQRQEQV